jgi:hypothetical protein
MMSIVESVERIPPSEQVRRELLRVRRAKALLDRLLKVAEQKERAEKLNRELDREVRS